MSESGIVCLFCLKFTELLEFVCIVLLSNLRYFRPLFLLIFFLHYVFFSSLSEAPVINARFFWLLSHRSLRLLSLFQFIFLSDVQIESLSLVNPPAHWLFPLSPLFWYWAGEWRLCFWFQLLCFPGGASDKESACQCRRHKRYRFEPWVRKIPWRRKWQPTPVFLPVEFHGQRSLAGYTVVSKESDMTEAT